jgi:XTP/dITP diphosphohydrolase
VLKIIVASKNTGKIKEINSLLNGSNYLAITMEEAGFSDDIIENGSTLEENAGIKARAIFDKVSTPIIADDSGLFVEALHGEPGIYSARYAGEPKSDEANIDKLLHELKDHTNRKAYFGAVICYIDNLGNEYFYNGEIHGEILHARQGAGGFGYDPIFKANGYNVSFAEMDVAEKNKISHRAIAMNKFIEALK